MTIIEKLKKRDDFNDFDDFDDEEEIDLVKLVSTNANDANQYLLFHGIDKQYYAKNVSKIEEIVVFKSLEIVKSYDSDIIIGVADIRGEMIILVNFDNWLCGKVTNEEANEFVIILNYGNKKFGLVVKGVEYIVTIEPDIMFSTVDGNSKSLFTSKILVNNKESLCTIIDSDQMLMNVFEPDHLASDQQLEEIESNIESTKLVLLADDSKLIQQLLVKICAKLKVHYKVLSNGQELLDEIKQHDADQIGLIVTDIEMPIMGGKEVIKQIREITKFNDINILVHTNMANEIMKKELFILGANEIISKVDIPTLSSAIQKFIR